VSGIRTLLAPHRDGQTAVPTHLIDEWEAALDRVIAAMRDDVAPTRE
jgi:hypothetical protein